MWQPDGNDSVGPPVIGPGRGWSNLWGLSIGDRCGEPNLTQAQINERGVATISIQPRQICRTFPAFV